MTAQVIDLAAERRARDPSIDATIVRENWFELLPPWPSAEYVEALEFVFPGRLPPVAAAWRA